MNLFGMGSKEEMGAGKFRCGLKRLLCLKTGGTMRWERANRCRERSHHLAVGLEVLQGAVKSMVGKKWWELRQKMT